MTEAGFWSARRIVAAVLGAVATALVVGVPTVVIPNPVFGRAVPVTWWSYPVLVVVAVLSGLLLATYLADPATAADSPAGRPTESSRPAEPGDAPDPASRRGILAGALSFFAVGCPVCNKVVLLALGSSGALTWFAPLQPLLALLSIAGLAWALKVRLANQRSCRLPQQA